MRPTSESYTVAADGNAVEEPLFSHTSHEMRVPYGDDLELVYSGANEAWE